MRIAILTQGHTNPTTAKTAASLVRYRGEEVVALIDDTCVGQNSGDLLGVGNVPVVASVNDVLPIEALFIGIAPPGGEIPTAWRAAILFAIEHGVHIVSGLHDYLCNDPEIEAAAEANGVTLHDVRRTTFREISRLRDFRPECLRVLTVGHDCSVGKMVTAIQINRELLSRGVDAKFVATGQTGIMIEGDGLPIDSMVADFISGAAESLVLSHEHHEILMVEGQGSLAHPSYSGVTLGLLHGTRPQGLIFCYDASRKTVGGLEHVAIRSTEELMDVYLRTAALMQPAEFIGIGMNTRGMTSEQANEQRQEAIRKFGLPVCDVVRDGPAVLADAVQNFKQQIEI